jgi:two-component sensor histidine kinase
MEAEELEYRLRQQELISELGLFAIHAHDVPTLAQEAARLAAEGLRSQFAKVLEYLPEEHQFVVFAGVGWRQGVVGAARLGADLESPAGYALRTGKPVVSNHLANEDRFRTPRLLTEHGILRAANVIIQGEGKAFGVLEADSPIEGKFDAHDLHFLQSLANMLAMGIERRRTDEHLSSIAQERGALIAEKDLLLNELNHRVKNNLQVVGSLLSLESSRIEDPTAKERFGAVAARVTIISRMHRHLYEGGKASEVEFGAYVGELCDSLKAFHAEGADVIFINESGRIVLNIDRAIPLALMINELVTNSLKHAFLPGQQGTVTVVLRSSDENVEVSVTDNGRGIGPELPKGLGHLLIASLARQLNAAVRTTSESGTTVEVVVPRPPRA